MIDLFIPSPSISKFQLGPVTVHIYALCLITGIVVAWYVANRRWVARGGQSAQLESVLVWAIPVGIVGSRVYHVLTHWQDYFSPGMDPLHALYIWEGGIAIYGAIGFGGLAAWWAARRLGLRFSSVADSLAPAIAIGQALGRFGNWFNQELYGLPTTLPWGLEIDETHRPIEYMQYATFHPTFLYESLWSLLVVCGVTLWADRRFTLGRGKVFALYVALYTFGRIWTESIRLDPSNMVFGVIRINAFAAALACLAAVGVLVWLVRNKPGREAGVLLNPSAEHPPTETAAEASSDEEPREG